MIRLSKILCLGVPDRSTYRCQSHRQSATIKQLQIYLGNKLSNATTNNDSHHGLRDLKPKSASLTALSTDEDLNERSSEEAVGNHKGNNSKSQHCQLEETFRLTSIEVSIAKILELMEQSVAKEQRRSEWSLLGALIDRILLIMLIIGATITTLYIYVIMPISLHGY